MHGGILNAIFPSWGTASFEPHQQFPGEEKYCHINKRSEWYRTKKSLLTSCVGFKSFFPTILRESALRLIKSGAEASSARKKEI